MEHLHDAFNVDMDHVGATQQMLAQLQKVAASSLNFKDRYKISFNLKSYFLHKARNYQNRQKQGAVVELTMN